jgi:iron complex transport system ATP-binding protein
VLAGLLPAASGQVLLHGRDLHAWPRRERAQHLAWLGQNEAAADDLTVYDVAMLGRLPHQPWLAAAQRRRPRRRRTGAAHHPGLGLAHAAAGPAVGRRAPARAAGPRLLAVQAQVLLMDEPLANLDPPHQADWLQLVRDLVAHGARWSACCTSCRMALQADDMAVLAQGRLRAPRRRAGAAHWSRCLTSHCHPHRAVAGAAAGAEAVFDWCAAALPA